MLLMKCMVSLEEIRYRCLHRKNNIIKIQLDLLLGPGVTMSALSLGKKLLGSGRVQRVSLRQGSNLRDEEEKISCGKKMV